MYPLVTTVSLACHAPFEPSSAVLCKRNAASAPSCKVTHWNHWSVKLALLNSMYETGICSTIHTKQCFADCLGVAHRLGTGFSKWADRSEPTAFKVWLPCSMAQQFVKLSQIAVPSKKATKPCFPLAMACNGNMNRGACWSVNLWSWNPQKLVLLRASM